MKVSIIEGKTKNELIETIHYVEEIKLENLDSFGQQTLVLKCNNDEKIEIDVKDIFYISALTIIKKQ